jgi:pimeloyl-ACP methyl ester carboxylesterase
MEVTALIEKLTQHHRVASDGVVEEVGTFDLGGRRLFFHIARPPGDVRATGVVLCHSYFELSMLQEAEISLARKTAAAGHACIYVQAPGMGDSEGVPEECMLADRVDAATAAFEELRARVPRVARPCFFGPRLGGLVATLAARRIEDAALALWDPNFDPSAYWKQVRRLARIAAVVGRQRFFDDPQIELDGQGKASVLGVEVTPSQLADLESAWSRIEGGKIGGPALLVCLDDSSARAAKEVLSPIVQRPVDTRVIGKRDIWQLGLRRGKGAIEPTIEWMKANLT